MSQSFWERTRPWACPACNKKNISANATECPQCHEPRVGSTAAPGSKVMSWRDRMRPWNCAACGQIVAGDKAECPKCHQPRPGSHAAQVEAASSQVTRVYEGEQALTAGIAAMARDGWRVVSQSSFQPGSGVGRTVALGFIGAALIKPPVKFTVIFERIPAPPGV